MKNQFITAKRIVIKLGTSTLTHPTGMLNLRKFEQLVRIISDIKNQGREIVLVSSGAIGVGAGKIGLQERPADTPSKQACAAIGQCELMYAYDKNFSVYNHNVSQVLLTKDVIDHPERKQNVINTFEKLLAYRTIPIVNENDTVSTEEILIGDNDTLSAIVAVLVGADALVLLSDIDGLYDKDPKHSADAKLIPHVETINDEIAALAGGKGSAFGTGGMVTKLHAAQIANDAGIQMAIINGGDPQNLYRLLDGAPVGTIFG